MLSQRLIRLGLLIGCVVLATTLQTNPASAQFFRGGAVGGVKVDAKGVLQNFAKEDLSQELANLHKQLAEPSGELKEATGLRMISLKRLQAAMEASQASGQPLPTEMLCLSGLQRIQYVFLYPNEKDIVIAGPAEPWTIREQDAAIVGVKSGRSPVMLEDLLVAFRAVDGANRDGITCSIEPTQEGQLRYNEFMSRLPRNVQPAQIEKQMRQAMGAQDIKLTGIPLDSRYAQVMVAADYQMKRIAMDFESSKVKSLPSYLQMVRSQGNLGSSTPRWWMACDYESLLHTPDQLAWELNGKGVKTMTDIDFVNADGSRSATGKVDALAQRWADLMTEQYDALSKQHAIFGDLRNIMDLTVVSALIISEGLEGKSGCALDVLAGRTGNIQPASYSVPRQVDTQCSFVKLQRGWLVSASGGISIDYVAPLKRKQQKETLTAKNSAIPQDTSRWWWNG